GADGMNEISGTGETVQFVNPEESLIINGHKGADTITVDSLDPAFAAELHVFGNNGDAPELTPDVAVDHVEFTGSISTGDKLLEVFAENVKVDAGVTLDTGEDDILFRARRIGTAELENLTPIAAGDAFTKTVSIDVGTGATLKGGG